MLDINHYPENLVGYDCVRIRDTRTVWINPDGADALAEELGQAPSDTAFARHFSYVSATNGRFDEAELDRNDRRTYLAERYGGVGVGNNGGGGRVGNFGRFQSKGVGPNPLVGGGSTWHAYGSLNLIDAAYEAIYSTILDGVLPLGAAKIYGIVRTSATGAYQGTNAQGAHPELLPAAGAVLVREPTVRPAHFLHAAGFAPDKRHGLAREPLRVRAAHRRLGRQFENNNGFIQFVGKFILASCRQFAFARAARIAHGGVTPSNICLDGRWIDLTEARFLSGGKNFRGLTPFFQEPQVIGDVVHQLMHVFGKCNAAHFNVEPLMRYFQTAFDGCFAYYALVVLGLPETGLEAIAESDDGKAVAKAYGAVVTQDKRPVAGLPDGLDADDPVIAFMRLSYGALADAAACVPALARLLRCAEQEAHAVATAFRNLFLRSAAAEQPDAPACDLRGRAIGSAIKALRWAHLSACFYRARIAGHLFYVGDLDEGAGLGAFIQGCIDESRWVFDTACRGEVVIVAAPRLRIHFDAARAVYVADAGGARSFGRYADCLAYVEAGFPDLRLRTGFDPFPYLRDIAGVLAGLERMSSTNLEA